MRRTVRRVRLAAVATAAVVLLSGCLRLDVTYLSSDELAGRQT